MFDVFNFVVLQARYVKAAMEKIPAFRPDGLAPADLQARITTANTVRATFITAETTKNLADGEREEAKEKLHLACIQVYPIMKSRFRKDPGSLSAINKLPVQDRTIGDTVERADKIKSLWTQLPNPPGSATPFTAWDTMDLAAFSALVTAATTLQEGEGLITQGYEQAQGQLHQAIDDLEDVVTAALIQGRGQFLEGTEREVIDAIPNEPAQQPPDQAVVSEATSPAPGAAHLKFTAPGGTSFDVMHKGPGDAAFAVVDDDTIERVYDATGGDAGSHDYKVIPRNSRGPGPESAVSTVVVA